jgi:aminomethyltransferase
MGEFWVKGPNALDLIQKLTTNDASKLAIGKAQYSCLPNGIGGIVDDLLVYRYEEEKYLLVVNASNIDKDWAWIEAHNDVEAEMEDASDRMSQLAVQGPLASKVIQKLTDFNLSTLASFSFVTIPLAGADEVIVATTGYTGAGGFEIYFNNEDGLKIWDTIFEAGKEFGIKPVGLAARDTLRLEMGYCLYGNDIGDTTSPIEAGLSWITKFVDGKDFIDRERLQKQKMNGVDSKLVGFEMLEKAIPRHGYSIVNEHGLEIGLVTSGTMSPSLKVGIGMGYIRSTYADIGSEIFIAIRNKDVKAKVVKMPFYSK